MSVVVGIDPSLRRTAFAVLPQGRFVVVESNNHLAMHRRLRALAEAAYRFAEQAGREAAAIPHVRERGEECELCGSPRGVTCLESGTVVRVVIEEPGWQGLGAVAIAKASGAILAGLPPTAQFVVVPVAVNSVRKALGIKRSGKDQEIKEAVVEYITTQGIALPRRRNGQLDADVADACALALWWQRFGHEAIAAQAVRK